MGAIYLGKKLGAGGFEKEVVLKQLLPEFTSRPEFRDLFFREAKISASIDHSNIVRTYDLVRSEDALFIVMEYVVGTDLRTIAWRSRIRKKPLSVAAILHIGMEVLAGLSYAHTRVDGQGNPLGIIHRDVSPSNIMCSGHGDVKLSDFGIAKAHSFASVFYRVRGKVGYMSPEQAHNRKLDGRSDCFSLAVCLYETFIGERLFTGDLQTSPDEVYRKTIPQLSDRRPDIPPGLQSVMNRALGTSPGDRYPSAAALAQALREVAGNAGLLYSASLLAAELTELLGPNAEHWSRSDYAVGDTERLPVGQAGAGGGLPPVVDDRISQLGKELDAAAAQRPGKPWERTETLPPHDLTASRENGEAHPVPSGTLETLAISSATMPAVAPPPIVAEAFHPPSRRKIPLFWILLGVVGLASVALVLWRKVGP